MFERLLFADDLRFDPSVLMNYLPGKELGVRQIILCHVINPPKDFTIDKFFFSRLNEELDKRAELLASLGSECKVELVRGEPAGAILKLSESYDVSVIVVGSHHSLGPRGSLIGSVSYSILHETVRPVFLLRKYRYQGSARIGNTAWHRHILYATDFSQTAEEAFLMLERIATTYHSKVTLYHVHDKARIDPYLRHMLPEFDREDKSRLQRLKEHLETNGASECSFQVSYGVPAQRLLRLANSGEFSLLIMGCQGRGFIPEVFLGSTANAIARHGQIPVLFVPHRRSGMVW